MPVNPATECAKLHARYTEIMDQLAGLPAAGSVGELGRSVSVSSAELKGQLDLITQQAAMLGCPIGSIGDPAIITTRGRA